MAFEAKVVLLESELAGGGAQHVRFLRGRHRARL
jgi:hypothetical protein